MKKVFFSIIIIALIILAYFAASPQQTGQLLDEGTPVVLEGEDADPIALPLDAEAPEGFEGVDDSMSGFENTEESEAPAAPRL